MQAIARTRAASGNFKPNEEYEKMQFYYHPDHLGSSSYITNLDGEVAQHIEYVPFGEVFIEERNNTWNTPYLFNAKEFDEETGLYYYGARYYEPRLSLWISTDPMEEKYPSLSSYSYAKNNPIILIDDLGKEPELSYIGTAFDFVGVLNNSPRQVGRFTGQKAANYLRSLGTSEWSWSQMRPLPTQTGYFNKKKGRYIYTTKGGWIDMVHFMFYAGKAYDYKLQKEAAQEMLQSKDIAYMREGVIALTRQANMDPVNEAVKDGYHQEFSDKFAAKHSAYSYEDLPSDKLGAYFGASYFDPNSKQTFGEQLKAYLNSLGATIPQEAPNYKQLPKKEQKTPSVMLQIRSYCNNHLIINVILKRLGVKAGKDSLPFAIFVPQNQEKMNIRERFGTLCSRLGVEFLCPYCSSNIIIKSGRSSTGKQRYRCKHCRKRFITDHTYKAYLPNTDSKITQLTKEGLGNRSTVLTLGIMIYQYLFMSTLKIFCQLYCLLLQSNKKL